MPQSNRRNDAYLGLEPVDERDDVRVLERLQHLKFIIDHALVSADILLQNNLDCNLFSVGRLRLANNAVGACTQRPSEFVESPSVRPER